jgi:hypothetical protein
LHLYKGEIMKLEELKKLESEATKGYWEQGLHGFIFVSSENDDDYTIGRIDKVANKKFITTSRNHFRAMLAVCEAANNYVEYYSSSKPDVLSDKIKALEAIE